MLLFSRNPEGKFGVKRNKATLARIADVTSMFGGVESRHALEKVYAGDGSANCSATEQDDSSENIVKLFLESVRNNNMDKLAEQIADDAQFYLPQESESAFLVQGKKNILDYIVDKKDEPFSLLAIKDEKILPIQNVDDVFVRWSGGGAFFTIEDAKIKTLQAYNS